MFFVVGWWLFAAVPLVQNQLAHSSPYPNSNKPKTKQKQTTVINQFLGRFSPDATVAKTITFSSLTTPLIFQTSIEGAVEKRQGRTYGPPGGRGMVVFIDDIAMPAINAWGDQVTNEIVRQLLEQGGMYSLDKPIGDVKTVADTRYVAAMCTPGALLCVGVCIVCWLWCVMVCVLVCLCPGFLFAFCCSTNQRH